MQILEHEPVTEGEQPVLQKIARMLSDDPPVSLLIGSEGEVVELPKAVSQVLKQLIAHIGHSRSVFVLPNGPMLTTQEAADLLGISRPYMVKLLKEEKLPYAEVGTHRRIHVDDVLEYKQRLRADQKRAIEEIAQISQDLGLYD